MDAVRRHLQISPNYARAARAAFLAQRVTAPAPSTAPNTRPINGFAHHDKTKSHDQEADDEQPEKDDITSRAVLIEYRSRKAQETNTSHGTEATPLP